MLQLPLAGKRILVTRPRGQEGTLVHLLEQQGAKTFHLPAVEVSDPADWSPVDAALERLADFHWMVFTSVNGVHALVRRLREKGKDLKELEHLQLAAIGPTTAKALQSYSLTAELVPAVFRSENLAAELKEKVAGKKVLLCRADRGRDILRQVLAEVAAVEQIAVYSQTDAIAPDSIELNYLRRGEIDFVTLTSSNIARAFAGALDGPCRTRIHSGEVKLVSISPVTSEAIKEVGLFVSAEAVEYTIPGLVSALVSLAQDQSPGAQAGAKGNT